MNAIGRSRTAARLLSTIVILAAGGCSGAEGRTGWLGARAKPVSLRTTTEKDRAATRVITPAGGTLSATGSDGTRYRLRIPRGALLSDARITLIPLRAVEGLPLKGGSVAAAQLEPWGCA